MCLCMLLYACQSVCASMNVIICPSFSLFSLSPSLYLSHSPFLHPSPPSLPSLPSLPPSLPQVGEGAGDGPWCSPPRHERGEWKMPTFSPAMSPWSTKRGARGREGGGSAVLHACMGCDDDFIICQSNDKHDYLTYSLSPFHWEAMFSCTGQLPHNNTCNIGFSHLFLPPLPLLLILPQ